MESRNHFNLSKLQFSSERKGKRYLLYNGVWRFSCAFLEHLHKATVYLQWVLGSKITADDDCSHEIKRRLLLGSKVMTNLDSILKSILNLANRGPSSQDYGFSSGQVWMWELDCEESWAPKNWCFWTVVLEKTLESPLDCKEIQPVHPKDQSWVLAGRTDAEAETPVLWPPHAKSWLIGKDPDAGRDLGPEEKGTTEDEMAGLHHRPNGHEFE